MPGVLKTEIDPLQPKVTILGNVNPQILIKKLLKVGKHAELCSDKELRANRKEANEQKPAETTTVKEEKEKQNHGCEQQKQPNTIDIKIEKTKDVTQGANGSKKDSKNDNKETNMTKDASVPEEIKKETPPLPHAEVDFTVHPETEFSVYPNSHQYTNLRTQTQYCYIAQPCPIAMPCHALPSYPLPNMPTTRVNEYRHFDQPRIQPPCMTPTVEVGDYFSDENTVGCQVM